MALSELHKPAVWLRVFSPQPLAPFELDHLNVSGNGWAELTVRADTLALGAAITLLSIYGEHTFG